MPVWLQVKKLFNNTILKIRLLLAYVMSVIKKIASIAMKLSLLCKENVTTVLFP